MAAYLLILDFRAVNPVCPRPYQSLTHVQTPRHHSLHVVGATKIPPCYWGCLPHKSIRLCLTQLLNMVLLHEGQKTYCSLRRSWLKILYQADLGTQTGRITQEKRELAWDPSVSGPLTTTGHSALWDSLPGSSFLLLTFYPRLWK